MLNQFIQICIQIRNVGHTAIGCLIDGLIDVVNGFLGYTPQLLPLVLECPQRDGGIDQTTGLPGHRGRLLRRQDDYLPMVGKWWLQG